MYINTYIRLTHSLYGEMYDDGVLDVAPGLDEIRCGEGKEGKIK